MFPAGRFVEKVQHCYLVMPVNFILLVFIKYSHFNPSFVRSQDQNMTLLFVPSSFVFISHLTALFSGHHFLPTGKYVIHCIRGDQISDVQSMAAKRGLTNRANVHTPMWKPRTARQNSSRSSNLCFNWTSFHAKQNKIKMRARGSEATTTNCYISVLKFYKKVRHNNSCFLQNESTSYGIIYQGDWYVHHLYSTF